MLVIIHEVWTLPNIPIKHLIRPVEISKLTLPGNNLFKTQTMKLFFTKFQERKRLIKLPKKFLFTQKETLTMLNEGTSSS